jgi:hypothetical protein
MEIFENAANGEIGAIVILVIAGLILMRFLVVILKFAFVQFPALFFGFIFGWVAAEEDGIYLDQIIEEPHRWTELIPYFLPSFAIAFVVWNIVLAILKAVFRSIFGKAREAAENASQVAEYEAVATKQREQRKARLAARRAGQEPDEIVTATEISAKQTRERHMKDYQARQARLQRHESAHTDKGTNQAMVQRQRKVGATVVRR